MKTFELNNKELIPAVGFGVFMIPNDGPTYDATLAALKAGYRHIDTAAGYMNESDVGKAIKDSGIDRKEIFITSKLWLQDYGYENAKKGIIATIKSIEDEQDTEITYYFGQELSNIKLDPQSYMEKVNKVNKQNVVDVANKVSINTIYFLKN